MAAVEPGFAAPEDVRPLIAEVRVIARMLRGLDGSLARR